MQFLGFVQVQILYLLKLSKEKCFFEYDIFICIRVVTVNEMLYFIKKIRGWGWKQEVGGMDDPNFKLKKIFDDMDDPNFTLNIIFKHDD